MNIKLVMFVLAEIAFVDSKVKNSCFKRCSTKWDATYPCQCSTECKEYGDCCEDYEHYCLVDTWKQIGRDELQKALKSQELNKNLAKNVIIFVGDGMDLPTTTAARILKGQLKGQTGEEEKISWETFPHVGLSKTYAADRQVPDSAAAGIALFCGVKSKFATIGVDETIELGVCSTTEGAAVDSIMISAQEIGKSTGIVTTSRITDATPADMYAHAASRNWEYEAEDGCADIAAQILTGAAKTNVIMGGGRSYLTPNTTSDPEYKNTAGLRTDDRNIIEEWTAIHKLDNYQYVWNKDDLQAVDVGDTDFLLGLFEPDSMQFEAERDVGYEPSLAEMTKKAIEILQKNSNGFLLMVEAARIDDAHHLGMGQAALIDTLALDEAVSAALRMVNTDETLVIVTSDHAHGMGIVGFPKRGNPILGINDNEIGLDGIPFTTLQYTSGPGAVEELQSFAETGHRRNLTQNQTADSDFLQPALIPTLTVNHGGQDVAIYAIGPMSHMFHSTHEQHYVAHVIRHAACMGEYKDDCSRFPTRRKKIRKRP